MKKNIFLSINCIVAFVLMLNLAEAQVVAPTSNTGAADLSKNWTLSKSYDPSGAVIGEGKQFFDDNGRLIQSQSKVKYRKDATTVYTHVFASQPVRDAYGRDALSSLSAPIDNSEFIYKSDFVRNPSGTAYGFANYDLYENGGTVTDKTNNPDAVGSLTTKGTLGWYYSVNNTWEPYTATTAYPFSRQTFYSDGTGNAKKSAGAGESYKMGTGRESSGYVTPVINELNLYNYVRKALFPASESGTDVGSFNYQSIQTFSRDANGRESVVFTDKGGNVLMVANAGRTESGNNLNITNNPTIGGPSFKDRNVLYFKIFAAQTVTITGTGTYTLYNMDTEQPVAGTTLAAGNYKFVNTGTTALAISYVNNYADLSFSFYNQLGQLIGTLAPEGVKKMYGTGYQTATKANAAFLTVYEYDTQGRLVATQNPENGRTEFVYRKDGKIRFSRNAEQALAGTYSYTNYDGYGRPVESGEYQPDGSGIVFNSDLTVASPMAGILENVSSTGGLTTGTKRDVTMTIYDNPDANLSTNVSGYSQDPFYLGGAVSVTKKYSSIVNNAPITTNLVSATWFNYDEEGKLLWQVQYINGIGAGSLAYKTTDYTYDPMGRLTARTYQKNTAAETFVHYYEYDPATQNLWRVYTGTDNVPANKILQATYTYFLHGPLKRVELATDVQGIDYTYTLHGALKAINNNDKTKDPGQDGIGGANAAVKPDAFGMVLDYYTNDYVNARTTGIQTIKGVNTTSTIASDSYTGNIKAVSWYSKKPTFTPVIPEDPLAYVYQYDVKDQLTEANWGNNINFTNTPASLTITSYNKEKIKPFSGSAPGYDLNGNILYLERTDGTGATSEKFQYNYTTNTNKLASITNSPSATTYASYTYDLLGQLTVENTSDAAQKKYIKYDVTGKVVLVARDAAFTQKVVEYVYNELGQRITKILYNGGTVIIQKTFYTGDVIYTQTFTGGVGGAITAQEYEIDGGSGRIGIYYRPSTVYAYQLTDHLGNVRAVVAKSGTSLQVRLYNDFYPYGKVITPATVGTNDYRYGYQGQYAEKDPETDWNAFELRMYDSKIARWLSIDPENEFFSPYVGMGNNPISSIDATGGEVGGDPCDGCLPEIIITASAKNGKSYDWWSTFADVNKGHDFMSLYSYLENDGVGTKGLLNFTKAWSTIGMREWQADFDKKYNAVSQTIIRETVMFIAGGVVVKGVVWGYRAYKVHRIASAALEASEIGTAAVRATEAVASGSQYSVAFEMELASNSYPGIYRGAHFLEANKALETAMATDATFSSSITELGISIPRSSAGSIVGKSPVNWVWHHDVKAGVMQLVPKSQHTVGSRFWSTLHPGGRGGFSIWGK